MFNIDDEEDANLSAPEVDKRLEMYKKMKAQLHKDLEANKQADQKHKMDELSKKIEDLERQKRDKEAIEREQEDKKKQSEEKRKDQQKGFLAGIKSFNVEDI